MGTGTKFKKGDSVKVTLEGTVENIVPFDDRIELRIVDDAGTYHYVTPDSGNVEKVEPPVEVFGPGDVVRTKAGGTKYLLGSGGYYSFLYDEWFDFANCITRPSHFTSEYHERVELS